MTSTYIHTQHIQTEIEQSSSKWAVLTFRADGTVRNGFGTYQTVWCELGRVEAALAWTLTSFRRAAKTPIRFAGYWGGDKHGATKHIHGVLELIENSVASETVSLIARYWADSISRKFKHSNLDTAVHQEEMLSGKNYLRYIARYEGESFEQGDSKLILNRSYLF